MAESNLRIQVTADSSQAQRELTGLQRTIQNLTAPETMQSMGASMMGLSNSIGNFGAKLKRDFGGPVHDIMETFGAVEDVMGELQAASGASAEQLAVLQDEFVAMGDAVPQPVENLISMAAAISKIGVEVPQLTEMTKLAAQMGGAFDISAVQVQDFVTAMSANFGLIKDGVTDIKGFNILANTINNLGDNLGVLERNIITFVTRNAGLAKVLKLSSGELAAFGTAMIKTGMPAAIAATAFDALTRRLTEAELKENADEFKALGVNVAEVTKAFREGEGANAIISVLEAINKAPADKVRDLVGEIFGLESAAEILQTANALEQVNSGMDLVAESAAGAGATVQETAGILGSGLNPDLQRLATAIKGVKLELADSGMLNVIKEIVLDFKSLVLSLQDLDPSLLKFIGTVLLLGYAFGFILGPIASIIGAMASLQLFLAAGGFTALFANLGAGISLVATSLVSLTAALFPIVFMAAAVIGAIIAVTLIVPTILGIITMVVAKIFEVIAAIAQWVEKVLGLPPTFSNALWDIRDELTQFASEMFTFGNNIMEGLADGIRSGVDAVTGAFSWVMDRIKPFAPQSDAQKGPLSQLSNWGKAIPQTMAEGIRMSENMLASTFADAMPTPTIAFASTNGLPSTPGNNVSNGDINVTVNLGGGEEGTDLVERLRASANDIALMVEQSIDNRNRSSYFNA